MNGIKFKGYKAFSDDWISIENFPNITVLIGRNNSGKSSCIDVIESLTNPIVYKQWFVRHMPKKGEHSREAKKLVAEIVSRLENIPDGGAESFPFELIDELKEEYLSD